jgi:hypothetical protein
MFALSHKFNLGMGEMPGCEAALLFICDIG